MDLPNHTALAGDLGFLLSRLGTATRMQLTRAVSPMDLTLRQFLVLRTISAHQGLSQAELGERLRIDPSSMVQVLDGCQSDGLTERRPGSRDRRRHALHLTGKGRDHLAKAEEAVQATEDLLFGALNASQRTQLTRLLLALAGAGPLSAPAAGPITAASGSVR